jgi:uncharacterized protein
MKCPVCSSSELKITDRQGVEIDYCPQCRGVWLDRGELDKLIERSAADFRSTPAHQTGHASYRRDDDDDFEDRGYAEKRKGKGKSFLSDLFDF